MSKKRQYNSYRQEFKEEAVALVTEQGYSAAEAAASLGIRTNQLYDWKQKQEAAKGDHERLHSANGDLSPVELEMSQIKVSGGT